LIVVTVFATYLPFISHHIYIPFLWSLLLIYLYGKNHLYTAVNSYLILLLILFADHLNFDSINLKNEFAYSSIVLFMTFLFVFIYQELAGKRFKVATVFSYIVAFSVYAIPIPYIIYAISFKTQITEDIIYAVSQTNTNESLEFVSEFISPLWIIAIIASAVIIGYLLLKQEKKETSKIEKSLLFFMIILTLVTVKLQSNDIRLYSFAKNGAKNYIKELKLFHEIQQKRKVGQISFKAEKTEQGETYIVIIGESLNKKHMGVYGYLRQTTPNLSARESAEELLIFNNVYSNHTHTMPVLSLALTEANQYNNKKYYKSLSILNILNQADIETFWITNQSLYGAWDNLVSVIAHEADHLVSLNRTIGKKTTTQNYDGVVIDEVKKILTTKTDKNRVIFIHLMGSHGSYSSRYPKDKYSAYTGKVKVGEFGTNTLNNDNINSYDNSIIYNDYVVSSILNELQKGTDTNALIYISDHADDVIGKLSHNSSMFTYEMTQIPMLAWFSEGYKKIHNDKYMTLMRHKNTLFSNDMFYDTMIGLFNIKTNRYSSKYDFTSKEYKLNPDKALVLHGKKHYTDKDNIIYWQKENTRYLLDTNQSSRIFPHRVDSVGKLKDIWNDGFRSFELDARFGDSNTNYFQMGYNHGVIGIKMEDFLLSVDTSQIERVWLDFKNLNEQNYKEALKRLEYLNNKYDIKTKFIVESGTKGTFFKEFNREGWHTSYYLPTGTIVKLIKDKNIDSMKKLAMKIAKQAKSQNLSAVSFDNRLYPFVKQYLEPKLSENIVYHTWWSPSLFNTTFKKDLQKDKLYQDQRVKTLLSRYKSQFDL